MRRAGDLEVLFGESPERVLICPLFDPKKW